MVSFRQVSKLEISNCVVTRKNNASRKEHVFFHTNWYITNITNRNCFIIWWLSYPQSLWNMTGIVFVNQKLALQILWVEVLHLLVTWQWFLDNLLNCDIYQSFENFFHLLLLWWFFFETYFLFFQKIFNFSKLSFS